MESVKTFFRKVLEYFKKTWMLWLVIGAALVFYRGAAAQFAVLLFLFSALAAVMLAAERILDPRDGWGLFPDINLPLVVRRATETPLSCAVLFSGLCVLLGIILLCAAMVLS